MLNGAKPAEVDRPLVLRLFGPLEVRIEGSPLARMRSRKEEWLLVLLALSAGRDVSRAWLAETLWPFPDYAEEHTRHYLRRSLMVLRRGLGDRADLLAATTPRTLRLDLSGVFCDVLAFDAAIVRGDPMSLEEAIGLYRGPLVADCDEPWILPERVRREDAYFQAVERLAGIALAGNEVSRACALARQAAAVAPLREPIHRLLMHAYAAGRRKAEALQVYHDLRARLRRENNCEPDPETTALFLSLRRDRPQERGSGGSMERMQEKTDRAADRPPGPVKLPHPLTTMIGRDNEVAEIVGRLTGCRLMTLAGPGGIGKTRLAIEAGQRIGERASDGVFFVDLSPLSDPALVAQTVAAALEAPETPGSARDAVIASVQGQDLLLILDNCEHLVTACADLAIQLLRECPNLRILATSRERLAVPGEVVWRVPGLSVKPAAASGDPADAIAWSPLPAAVRLFEDRAVRVHPEFALTAQNLPHIADICARLDGMPLGIELAAASIRAMPVIQLSRRLDAYFDLLFDLPAAGPARQKTVRTALDWSFGLLEAAEQAVLIRLSVFAGGCPLEGAEYVCPSSDAGGLVKTGEVLWLLLRLADKSLVVYEIHDDGGGRYRLLHTVRQFAMEKLALSGAASLVGGRYREWLLSLAEEAEAAARGPDQALWLNRLEREHDNFRSALLWFESAGAEEMGLRLAVSLAWFWILRGHGTEGRGHLAALLDRSGTSVPELTRLRAVCCLAELAASQGDFSTADRLYRDALAQYRRMNSVPEEGTVLAALGGIASNRGDYAEARVLLEAALAMTDDPHDQLQLCGSLGFVAREQGDYVQSRAHLERAIALGRERGDLLQVAAHLGSLAHVVLKERGPEAALPLLDQTLATYRMLGNLLGQAWTLASIGSLHLVLGDFDRCRLLVEEALAINREAGRSSGEAWNLRILGELKVRQGEYGEAEVFLHQALTIDRRTGALASEAWSTYWLGRAAAGRGESERASEVLAGALARMQELGIPEGIVDCVTAIAQTRRALGDPDTAAGLLDALREAGADADAQALGTVADRALAAARPPER